MECVEQAEQEEQENPPECAQRHIGHLDNRQNSFHVFHLFHSPCGTEQELSPIDLSTADQSHIQVIAKVGVSGKMHVVFRLVRCRVANGMSFLVKNQACTRVNGGAKRMHFKERDSVFFSGGDYHISTFILGQVFVEVFDEIIDNILRSGLFTCCPRIKFEPWPPRPACSGCRKGDSG